MTHKDDTLICAFGNTGCGKSTMFTSLVYGKECLHLTKIEEKYMKKNRKTGEETPATKMREVID